MKNLNDILTKLKFDKDADLIEAHQQILDLFVVSNNEMMFAFAKYFLKFEIGATNIDGSISYRYKGSGVYGKLYRIEEVFKEFQKAKANNY